MRILLITEDDAVEDELRDVLVEAGLDASIVRSRTFKGAQMVLMTTTPDAVVIDQALGRRDEGLLKYVLTALRGRATVCAIGGHTAWAAQVGIKHLLPRPLLAQQVSATLAARRLGVPAPRRVPTSSAPATNVSARLQDAVDLLGRAAVAQVVHDFRADPSAVQRWHPWAPGLEWFVSGARSPIPPYATSVAREMTFLTAIPRVLTEVHLRARVRERILKERDAAVFEATIAGGTNVCGGDAIWSAITAEDTADILVRGPDPVDVQVKARRRRAGDPMVPLSSLYDRIREAANQTRKDRVGLPVLVITGAPAWEPWRFTAAGQEFLLYVRDVMFRESRFSNVPGCLIASGPLATGTSAEQNVHQGAWFIYNLVSTTRYLPPELPLFTE